MLMRYAGTTPTASNGHQDPDLRAAAYGQCDEEGYRVAGIREAEAGQQAG